MHLKLAKYKIMLDFIKERFWENIKKIECKHLSYRLRIEEQPITGRNDRTFFFNVSNSKTTFK